MAIFVVNWDEAPAACCQRCAVAIGNFDGVHRGHLALLAELQRRARTLDGPAVVVTFDPHPLQLLRPAQFQPLLTTVRDRAELLEQHGADHVLILRTTSELLHLTAEEFFEEVVRRRLAARAVVEGLNFGFGRNREGNVQTLGRLCAQSDMELTIVPPLLTGDGFVISSSRVRTALVAGDVRGAAALLGRPYRLRGTVAAGQRRGQTLGFPTANLEQPETLIPADGVYALRVHHNGTVWAGAGNVGPNPTFGELSRKVEVHLIGFQGDLYGKRLGLDFIERLRDTRPFASIDELVAQLRADVREAARLVGP